MSIGEQQHMKNSNASNLCTVAVTKSELQRDKQVHAIPQLVLKIQDKCVRIENINELLTLK